MMVLIRSVRGNHRIQPTGARLVEGGHALRVDVDDPRNSPLREALERGDLVLADPPKPEPKHDDRAPLDYQAMTVPELRDLLAGRGVDVPTRARKADLVALAEGGD